MKKQLTILCGKGGAPERGDPPEEGVGLTILCDSYGSTFTIYICILVQQDNHKNNW